MARPGPVLSCLIACLLLAACRSPAASLRPARTVEAAPAAAAPAGLDSLAGRPLKASRPAIYRLMEDGQLRHITGWAAYLALGYTAADVITLSDQDLARFSLGPPLTRWLAVAGQPELYYLQDGRRYRLPDLETLAALGGTPLDVSLVNAGFLQSLPLAGDPLPAQRRTQDERDHPQLTAALWASGFLWTANETGLLTRWEVETGHYQAYYLPGRPVIRALAGNESGLYAGVEGGQLWRLAAGREPERLLAASSGWISALALAGDGQVWYADASHLDPAGPAYRLGRGLGRLRPSQAAQAVASPAAAAAASDPLRYITALAVDPQSGVLWVGTGFAGVWRFDPAERTWQSYQTFNSGLADNQVNDLKVGPGGSLWLATPSGVSLYQPGSGWQNQSLAEGLSAGGALSLALAGDGAVWVAGDQYLARREPGGGWQVYTALDQPLLADSFGAVVLAGQDRPWFLGRRRKIHFDGQTWLAFDQDVRRSTEFSPGPAPTAGLTPSPRDFPSPLADYVGWLKTWPRPAQDNGRGMHFVQSHWLEEIEAQQQVNRLQRLGVRWALVNYANHYQLQRLAPLFAQAGITVVWRPFLRPYESYDYWAEDVEFLRSRGLAPYLQLYNEPSLAKEWDPAHPLDREVYLAHLLPAVRQVYAAGGYVGLQFIDPDWLRLALQRLKSAGLAETFDRLFFVSHPYGLNHPPAYDEDINGVLGFLKFAPVFEQEIGFVPVMIAGEGGWRPGEAQDSRYPPVSETLHRDYHLAVFDWFRTGRLSNGQPLPDYLFAFCPWLIADPTDPAAWFDSSAGDRSVTITAVEALPPFERKFSWEGQVQ